MWYQGFVNLVFFAFNLIIIVVSIMFIIGGIFALILKARKENSYLTKGKLQINKIGKNYKITKKEILEILLNKKDYKNYIKKQNKLDKLYNKPEKKVFIIKFKGDIQASQVENLRKEISIILEVAKSTDEIIIRIDSPGGVVNGYGFATAQLERIREAGVNLTICIDKIAASGGYMMAATGNQIISSPFAIVGSIGVVGTIPNIKNLLEKNGINVEMHTSGKYKRTLTSVGNNNEEGRKKFKQDLENIHQLFKQHILNYRPNLDVNKISTGEYWFGKDALELGLVDKIQTYDDYLINLLNKKHDVYKVSFIKDKDRRFFKNKFAIIKKTLINVLYACKIL